MGQPPITPAQYLQADRLRFPGMLPREIIIFKAWLSRHEKDYDRFDFNVRVGRGSDPGPGWDAATRAMAIMNSQKRIDAVAWHGNQPVIIEVKDRAGLSVVGQLVGYRALWPAAFPGTPTPKLLLVTNRPSPDLLPVLQHADILMEVVQADFSQLGALYRGRHVAGR